MVWPVRITKLFVFNFSTEKWQSQILIWLHQKDFDALKRELHSCRIGKNAESIQTKHSIPLQIDQ